jgi:hypothetical protein
MPTGTPGLLYLSLFGNAGPGGLSPEPAAHVTNRCKQYPLNKTNNLQLLCWLEPDGYLGEDRNRMSVDGIRLEFPLSDGIDGIASEQ